MNRLLYKSGNFEGPLDLMLQLILKNKLNIQDVVISDLLDQYMDNIRSMQSAGMDIESEFLEMAARLVYIKSVSLLPKQREEEEELRKELQSHLLKLGERRLLAGLISQKISFDSFVRAPQKMDKEYSYQVKISKKGLLESLAAAVGKDREKLFHNNEKLSEITSRKIVSVYSRVMNILRRLRGAGSYSYNMFFNASMGRSALVATFLAVLELIKGKRIFIKKEQNNMTLFLEKGGRKHHGGRYNGGSN